MSVGVYIGIDAYKLFSVFGPFGPSVWGLYVSWFLDWYFIYHAKNSGDVLYKSFWCPG